MLGKRSLFKNQNYTKLKDDCLKNGELFCDDLFELDVPGAIWLRPKDIAEDPKFFDEELSIFDVIQGEAKNCWLVVAMANLVMQPTLLHRVIPMDQGFTENYAGIFRFNIWQCGTWTEVVIDDRLPTKEGKSGSRYLMFAHSKCKKVFWSALLEKAYAKLYGSYNELNEGWPSESLVDLTGGIAETIKPTSKNLETIITKSHEKGSLICVYMDNPLVIKNRSFVLKNGLVTLHAYTVMKIEIVHQGGQSVMLLRLRNPWGKKEWNRAWSDTSVEWKSISFEEKTKIGLVFKNDGEFWMSFEDFANTFYGICICHLTPNSLSITGENERFGWQSHLFKGEWIKGITAGGVYEETFHMNPQYRIVLTDTDDDSDNLCTVIICLMQRNKTRKVWHEIGFTAFLLEGSEKLLNKPLSKRYIRNNLGENSFSSTFERQREVVVRGKWKPGVYCIIPSTYMVGCEGQYLLRVYSEKKASMEHNEVSLESLEPVMRINLTEQEEPFYTQKATKAHEVKKLLNTNDQEVFEYFRKIADSGNTVRWYGLYSVIEYALSKDQSSDEDSKGILSKILTWLINLFFGSPKEKLFSKDECRALIAAFDNDHSGLSNREFQILWRTLRGWASVFVIYCNESNCMKTMNLSKALKKIGYKMKTSDISRLVIKYSDQNGILQFGDFIMCCIELFNAETT